MIDVKLFRACDLDLTPDAKGIVTAPVVNRRISTGLGAGIGVFENCDIEWTVTYDEVPARLLRIRRSIATTGAHPFSLTCFR